MISASFCRDRCERPIGREGRPICSAPAPPLHHMAVSAYARRTDYYMIGPVKVSSSDIYEAVLALSRCIAGRNDLESLLSGVSESLRRIVGFEHVALILHDASRNEMRSHVLNARGATPVRSLCLPFDQDPAGWVWMNQQPLVIPSLAAEDRWPEFREHARAAQVCSLTLVPLTSGENRLGAFGFGSASPYQPTASEVAFLERVASEFAVAVEAHLAKQALVHERDRLQTLFEITNALVSKLSPDELSSAIAEQLSRVVQYDFAVLSLCNEQTGGQDLHALHFNGPQRIEKLEPHIDTTGMPAGGGARHGKAGSRAKARFRSFCFSRLSPFGRVGISFGLLDPLAYPERGHRNLGNRPDPERLLDQRRCGVSRSSRQPDRNRAPELT